MFTNKQVPEKCTHLLTFSLNFIHFCKMHQKSANLQWQTVQLPVKTNLENQLQNNISVHVSVHITAVQMQIGLFFITSHMVMQSTTYNLPCHCHSEDAAVVTVMENFLDMKVSKKFNDNFLGNFNTKLNITFF